MKKAILFTTVLSLALLLGACSAKSDEEETAETMKYDFNTYQQEFPHPLQVAGLDCGS